MSSQVFYWILLGAVLAFVWEAGGAPERMAAAAWALASILSAAAVVFQLGSYETLQVGVFGIDLALLVFLIWLSLRADRIWPLLMTGVHLFGVMTHVAKALKPDLHPWAYAVGQAGGSYIILATITVGAARHRWRVRQTGRERSWRGSSGR